MTAAAPARAVTAHAASDAGRHRGALAAKPVWERIWTTEWEKIEGLEIIPGVPLREDVWVIPPWWAPAGTKRRLSCRTLDFSRCLPGFWARGDERSELVIRRAKRLACLLFLRALRIGNALRNPPSPSTWVWTILALFRAMRRALLIARAPDVAKPSTCPDTAWIFGDLPAFEVDVLVASDNAFGVSVVPRLNALLAARAMDDWPSADVAPTARRGGRSRPFSDGFTAEVGHAAIWVMETLGPDLLSCWAQFRAIDASPAGGRGWRSVRPYRRDWLSTWAGTVLKPGFPFLYGFQLRSHDGAANKTSTCGSWPPADASAVRDLVSVLQGAHMVVLALATATRDSELVDLRRDCIKELRSGELLVGHTFKLSEEARGERRNWPLPKAAVQAIQQQRALAESMDPAGHGLWVRFKGEGESALLTCRSSLVSFCRRVLLPGGRSLAEACDGDVQLRRFRKTVVRLAALSLVGANQILFDVLGHRDPEMTLSYILSDPEIQDEMRQIAHEAAVALAKEALLAADENGGPAAAAVKEMKARLVPRSAEREMEVQRLDVAAEILSQNGRTMLVKPNVLCTKTFNQFGPCSRRAGNPDIGNCQGDCMHRLEIAAARADHRKAVAQILGAIPAEDCMMRTWWQGQLLSHLMPFADLRHEMLADARVRAALVGVSPSSIDMLEERHRDAARAALMTA